MLNLMLFHDERGEYKINKSQYNRSGKLRVISLASILVMLIGSFAACYCYEFSEKRELSMPQKDDSLSQTDTKQNTDTEPPVVSASDFEITLGDSVSYKSHIAVSDNEDEAPQIDIDTSNVDLDKPGTYTVIYTVTDRAGNSTVVNISLTVREKEINEIDLFLSEQSKSILERIIDENMNDMQKAYAIYYYVKNNIAYAGDSDKSDYKIAAMDGLKQGKGDCFTYFAISKVLLDAANIQNVDMVKLRLSADRPRHYWSLINVGSGWYHYDSTRFSTNGNLFMLTDEELKKWDNKYYRNCHNYSTDGLPERSTESVQKTINYGSSKLKVKD